MKIISAVILFFFMVPAFAQNNNGKIIGTIVKTDSEQKLSGVLIRIEGKKLSTLSDKDGLFFISNIKPGKYYLTFTKKGFYSLVVPEVKVTAGKITKLHVEMYPGNEKEFLFLEIGGIQVTANRDLLPDEPETVHRITSGQIEHMQATNLADVLDMIPGNEKSHNLGLGSKQNINLRNLGDQASSFGTKIILDDVPLSNNADLQTGVGVNYGTKVQSSAGSEYDLREVVADNLKDVEVQSGATSVEYGDNTSGVIIAHTRTRNVPTRFKVKNNPDTKEANLMGSFHHWNTDFVYNFNYGYSERDIRIKGDEFHRFAGSLKANNKFFNNRLNLLQTLRYARKLEEDNDASDPYKTKAYNRDFHITYSQQFNFKWNRITHIYVRNYLDYKHRNSWFHKLETRDLSYATTLKTPGTMEGIFAQPVYFSDVRTIGDEWAYGIKMKAQRKFFTGRYLHRVLVGSEYLNEWNNGPGKQFDILRPPNGGGHVRPRSFNDIPGISQLALFAEDRITGKFIRPFTFDFGFRMDSYNPSSFKLGNLISGKDIFAARQGSFFNPSVGLKVKLQRKTQLRLTFSKASKAPGLYMLYPEKYYLDVNDYTEKHETLPDGRDTSYVIPLISTYVFDRTNKHLKGYQSTKYELGIDQKVGKLAFSLVGYFQRTDNVPSTRSLPLTYYRYEWPNWPSAEGKVPVEKVVLGYSGYRKSQNTGWVKNSGLEFTLRTHRIPKLNMRFWINGAYTFSRSGSKANAFYYASAVHRYKAGDTLATGWVVPEDMQIIPYYRPTSGWRQKTVINYNVDYIARSLGIWLTFKAQQVLWDRYLSVDHPYNHALGYYKDGKNIAIDAATSTKMQLDRSYDPLSVTVDRSKPNDKWLFSIVASKALFKGAEISIFVDNIFNDPAYYRTRYGDYASRNPEMFWGIAFSAKIDHLFKQ